MFLNHCVEFFTEIEIFEEEKDFDFELWTFHGIKIVFVIDHGIVHLFNTDSVIEKFFFLVVQNFISYIKQSIPTLIF